MKFLTLIITILIASLIFGAQTISSALTQPDFSKYSSSQITPWPMFGHDVRHTGRSLYATTNNFGGLKWSFKTDSGIETSPAIGYDGTIYFADWTYLYAIYPNGTLKWRSSFDGQCSSSPAIGPEGTIYYGTSEGFLYAINENGSEKWSFVQDDDIAGAPTVSQDGTIYFGTFDQNGTFYALNSNGSEKWHYDADYYSHSSPVIDEDAGIVYFASHVFLYAFNPAGTLIWKIKLGDPNYTFLGSPSLGDDGTIYIPCDPGYLYAINTNGTIKWQSPTEWGSWAAPTIASDGTIYVGSKHMYAFYPDGALKWEFKPDGDEEHFIDSNTYAISADGTIYFGTNWDYSSCYLFAVNSNGTEKWRAYTGDFRALSSPAIAEDGTIYIGSFSAMESYLIAFNGERFIVKKPEPGKLYVFSQEKGTTPRGGTICIGPISIEAIHPNPANVTKVEFYLDGKKQYETATPPYQWLYDKPNFRRHTVTVVAIDKGGFAQTISLKFWKIF
jgi:outer membrane protein assembly factor BamB